jgi:glycerophosphoryl diester phosphodiesterase
MTLRLAHRGDSRVGPENGVRALVAGASAPRSDGVEFDVLLAADGTPVVIHDEDLQRVQGVDAAVADLTAAELAVHGVPTLAEVLEALPEGAFLDVELKVVPNAEVARVLLGACGETPERAVVSSFEPRALRATAALMPGWPRWLNVATLSDAVIAAARDLGCAGVAAEWHAISPRTARAVREAGLDLAAWTVLRRPTFERLARLGVVAVCVEGAALDG